MNFDKQTTQAFKDIITCNSRIMSGTPVFKNTRVPIKNLIDYLEAGDDLVVYSPRFYGIFFLSMVLFCYLFIDQNGEENLDGKTSASFT